MAGDLAIINKVIEEDWELVKDTAGTVADRKAIFELAFRFGWHAATKYGNSDLKDIRECDKCDLCEDHHE